MLTAHAPVIFDLQVVLEIEQQVIAGHLAAGEKVFRHPVIIASHFVVVGIFTVGEDVHEELAARLQPGGDSAQEFLVVLHVLKHLHRDTAVEDSFSHTSEMNHVGSDDRQILQAPLRRLSIDEQLLRARIGHAGDLRIRIMFRHPQ